jgi:hypothetical protein
LSFCGVSLSRGLGTPAPASGIRNALQVERGNRIGAQRISGAYIYEGVGLTGFLPAHKPKT